MRYELLREMIEEKPDGIEKTAVAIGVTAQEVKDKLSGKAPLFVYDVYAICTLFNINDTEEKLKFFYSERPKSGTRKGARST